VKEESSPPRANLHPLACVSSVIPRSLSKLRAGNKTGSIGISVRQLNGVPRIGRSTRPLHGRLYDHWMTNPYVKRSRACAHTRASDRTTALVKCPNGLTTRKPKGCTLTGACFAPAQVVCPRRHHRRPPHPEHKQPVHPVRVHR
jgi:hypothetical protein